MVKQLSDLQFFLKIMVTSMHKLFKMAKNAIIGVFDKNFIIFWRFIQKIHFFNFDPQVAANFFKKILVTFIHKMFIEVENIYI